MSKLVKAKLRVSRKKKDQEIVFSELKFIEGLVISELIFEKTENRGFGWHSNSSAHFFEYYYICYFDSTLVSARDLRKHKTLNFVDIQKLNDGILHY